MYKLPTISASRTLPMNFKIDLKQLTEMEIMEKNAKDESKQKHFLHKTHRLLSENDVENEQAL